MTRKTAAAPEPVEQWSIIDGGDVPVAPRKEREPSPFAAVVAALPVGSNATKLVQVPAGPDHDAQCVAIVRALRRDGRDAGKTVRTRVVPAGVQFWAVPLITRPRKSQSE